MEISTETGTGGSSSVDLTWILIVLLVLLAGVIVVRIVRNRC